MLNGKLSILFGNANRFVQCLSVSEEKTLASSEKNVVAVAGSVEILNCSSSSNRNSSSSGTSALATRWHYTGYGQETTVGVYNGQRINDNFLPRYSAGVDSATLSCPLTIRDLQLSDAGTYRCYRLKSASVISIIHLTAIGTCVRHCFCFSVQQINCAD